ncbi:MAG: tetratricopeptide repeat protein [Phycisphaerales bacterium]|nr:MAG: tetratricopeptide repeat protein [Phycisphaerales bacterium]
MRTSILATLIIGVCATCVCDMFAEAGGKSFKNYDNDPCLAEAMSHDPEYAVDVRMKSQSEAEKHYLAYLKKEDIPSFQRANVYCQLGVLYTTCASGKRGEKRDHQKAERYFKKVLELEPDRIGRATVRARTMLCSLGSLPLEELVARGLDTYEWISAIEVDEETIESRVLPNRPGEKRPDSLVVTSLMNSLPRIERMVARNTVHHASSLADSARVLADIMKRFPDKQIATFAREELNKRADKVADAQIDTLGEEQRVKKEDTSSPGTGKAVGTPAHSEPNKPDSGKEELQTVSVNATASNGRGDGAQHTVLPVAAACVGILAVAVLTIAGRKKGRPM